MHLMLPEFTFSVSWINAFHKISQHFRSMKKYKFNNRLHGRKRESYIKENAWRTAVDRFSTKRKGEREFGKSKSAQKIDTEESKCLRNKRI